MSESPAAGERWRVMRQDTVIRQAGGNTFEIRSFATEAEAQRFARTLEARGHKQMYWVEGPSK